MHTSIYVLLPIVSVSVLYINTAIAQLSNSTSFDEDETVSSDISSFNVIYILLLLFALFSISIGSVINLIYSTEPCFQPAFMAGLG
jgi:hypothetical protein